MTLIKKIIPLIILSLFLSNCSFLKNSLAYKKGTEEFVTKLLSEDYEYCTSKLDEGISAAMTKDSLIASLASFRSFITDNWDDDLSYTFMGAEKSFSTLENSLPPHATTVHMQFENEKYFGVVKAIFNDNNGQIISIHPLKNKWLIPNMIYFWLFGLLGLAVLLFNIYTIWKIKKSQLNKKWLHYLLVFIFNTPVLSYHAISGFSFKILSFQFLLGISFNFMGYLNTAIAFGIPLGSIYCLWKINKQNKIKNIEEQA